MVDSRSDDELRRIVFGRGSSDRDVADASAELARRSADREIDTEAVDVGPATDRDPDFAFFADEPDPGEFSAPPRPRPRGRALVIGAVVALLALAVGWGSRSLLADAAPPETPTGSPGVGMESPSFLGVTDPADGKILYTITRGEAEDLGYISEEPFPIAPDDETQLPGELGSVQASTARYLGRLGDLRGAWTARTSGGGYCVLLAFAGENAYASSCSPPQVFAVDGVRISDDRYVLTWNPRTLILSMNSD